MLQQEDNHNDEIPKDIKNTSRRLIRLLFEQKAKFIIIIASSIMYAILLTAIPMILATGVDNLVFVIKNSNGTVSFEVVAEALKKPIIYLTIASVAFSLFCLLQEFTMSSVSETLTLTLRKAITEKLSKVPMNYFDNHKVGDILTRTTLDLDKVSEVLQVGLLQLITSTIVILLGVGIMIYISPVLTLVVLLVLALSSIVTKKLAMKNQIYFGVNQEALGNLGTKAEELYTGNQLIKAFNKQEDSIKEMKELNEKQYKAFKKAQFVAFAINPTIRFINQLGFVLSGIVGGILVINGSISIGIVQAYLQYVNQVSEPVTQASYVINSLQSAIAALERVFEITDSEVEISDSKNTELLEEIQGRISFENVEFGYRSEKIIMKDVSFEAKPKEMVAIVGPTGAGKTTLVNLLMRFYELNGGKITLDGMDISRLKRSDLRKKFGMVLQDTWLFEGTVAENIAYGKKDATREEIIKVAKDAKCHHFIKTLPQGYDTIISSDAPIISQGQQQLLTIARAMLANPSVLILDEATSSVDTRTELAIQKAMEAITKGKTSFVIAHRLSTIKNANLILVMKDGDIIEKGTHKELLSKKSFYADLYNNQFANS